MATKGKIYQTGYATLLPVDPNNVHNKMEIDAPFDILPNSAPSQLSNYQQFSNTLDWYYEGSWSGLVVNPRMVFSSNPFGYQSRPQLTNPVHATTTTNNSVKRFSIIKIDGIWHIRIKFKDSPNGGDYAQFLWRLKPGQSVFNTSTWDAVGRDQIFITDADCPINIEVVEYEDSMPDYKKDSWVVNSNSQDLRFFSDNTQGNTGLAPMTTDALNFPAVTGDGDSGDGDSGSGGSSGVVTDVTLTLNGDPEVTIDKFFPYVDEGATGITNIGDPVTVQVDNPVDTNISGEYVITYTGTHLDSGISGTMTRKVVVRAGEEYRTRSFDTFAVSTNDSWHRLPSRAASELRLSNMTGRVAGIRLRHRNYVIDDFEDGYDKWQILDGTLERMPGLDIAGKNSGELEGRIAKKVPYLGDEYTIQISFHSLYGDIKVGLFDSLERVGLISSGTAGTTVCFNSDGTIYTSAPSSSSAKWVEDKTYILTLEVHPTKELFTAELIDGVNRQVIAQGQDSTNELGGGGGVKLPGLDYYLGIEATSAVIDEVLYLKKHSEPHEIMAPGSSYVFPCDRNINEYEILNIGSEPASYMDNTDNITLTGFYR